jgi:hypothetical protein
VSYALEFYSLSWDDLKTGIGDSPVLAAQSATDTAPMSDEAIGAFVELVLAKGTPLGSLQHAGGSGGEFLTEFLDTIATEAFDQLRLSDVFIDREICGLKSPEVWPSWGGLTKAEVKELVDSYAPPSDEIEDEDMLAWLDELVQILRDAEQLATDVVTVYR